jgi:hypothetical protein
VGWLLESHRLPEAKKFFAAAEFFYSSPSGNAFTAALFLRSALNTCLPGFCF